MLGVSVNAASLVLPHIVDGGAWQSTIVLTNTSANAASGSLTFHQETTGGNTSAWNPPFLETVSTSTLNFPGGSTLFLHTADTAPTTTQGWGELVADPSVIGYVIFTNKGGGHESDGTAPAVAPTSRILVPYDDANGNKTGIAIANTSANEQSIMVAFRNNAGDAQGAAFTLPPFGHTSFILSDQFTVIRGFLGLAEFYSTSGTFSIIGLRINSTNSFTSAPAYFEGGAPLIVSTTDPGSGYMPPPYSPYGYVAPPAVGGAH